MCKRLFFLLIHRQKFVCDNVYCATTYRVSLSDVWNDACIYRNIAWGCINCICNEPFMAFGDGSGCLRNVVNLLVYRIETVFVKKKIATFWRHANCLVGVQHLSLSRYAYWHSSQYSVVGNASTAELTTEAYSQTACRQAKSLLRAQLKVAMKKSRCP